MNIIDKGSHISQTFRYAYILLNCDKGKHGAKIIIEQISTVLKVGIRTIDRVKRRFIEDGVEATLECKPSSRVYERTADGDLEAKLVALCCSKPPKGHSQWSLRLLADNMVELKLC